MKSRVVTGVGIVCALGSGRTAFAAAMGEAARPAHDRPPETFDASAYARGSEGNVRVAEVPGFDPAKYLGDKGLRSLDRLTKLLVVACRLALHDAGLKKDGQWSAPAARAEGVGLVLSNAYGSLEAITELDRVAVLEDARYINPSRFPLTVANSAAGYASIWEDLRAMNVSVSDGNCGALDAVACADVFLDHARADALLVGGAEAMSEAIFLGFRRLGATAAVLGEGAAIVVVETPEAARARGASVLGSIEGYGTSFAAPERAATLIHSSPEAVERAIRDAIADARIESREVDVVVSGVSGLRAFDEAELLAVRRVLGDDVCIVAPKLALGETLGASGAMAMAAALAWLGGAPLAHVVRGTAPARARTALVTSMGFYGNASAVIMKAP